MEGGSEKKAIDVSRIKSRSRRRLEERLGGRVENKGVFKG